MIKQLIEILKISDFYGIDPIIDIAKANIKHLEQLKNLRNL